MITAIFQAVIVVNALVLAVAVVGGYWHGGE